MTNQSRFAALDVSLEKTAICVMSLDGTICKEAVIPTDPDAIATWLAVDQKELERIGLEAGPLSEWLVRGLAKHGIVAVLMETRQIRAASSAMIVKTDRKDARGYGAPVAHGMVPAGPRQNDGRPRAADNARGTHDLNGPP